MCLRRLGGFDMAIKLIYFIFNNIVGYCNFSENIAFIILVVFNY